MPRVIGYRLSTDCDAYIKSDVDLSTDCGAYIKSDVDLSTDCGAYIRSDVDYRPIVVPIFYKISRVLWNLCLMNVRKM